jgi:hypothetical protein
VIPPALKSVQAAHHQIGDPAKPNQSARSAGILQVVIDGESEDKKNDGCEKSHPEEDPERVSRSTREPTKAHDPQHESHQGNNRCRLEHVYLLERIANWLEVTKPPAIGSAAGNLAAQPVLS